MRDAPLQRHVLKYSRHRPQQIEARVQEGLRERMMAPELVAAFIDEFKAELHRLTSDAELERNAAHHALAEANLKIVGILKAIEDEAYHPTLKERLTILEKETAAAARLAASQSKRTPRLNPNLRTLYQRKVQRLVAALNEPGTAVEVCEIIRGLIDRIVLTSCDSILKVSIRPRP
jgi:hypothetical protein